MENKNVDGTNGYESLQAIRPSLVGMSNLHGVVGLIYSILPNSIRFFFSRTISTHLTHAEKAVKNLEGIDDKRKDTFNVHILIRS